MCGVRHVWGQGRYFGLRFRRPERPVSVRLRRPPDDFTDCLLPDRLTEGRELARPICSFGLIVCCRSSGVWCFTVLKPNPLPLLPCLPLRLLPAARDPLPLDPDEADAKLCFDFGFEFLV